MPGHLRIYRTKPDGVRVDGTVLRAFWRNGDTYYLTDLCVYQDEKLDPIGISAVRWLAGEGSLIDFEEFVESVRSGRVTTELPIGARVSVSPLARFHADSDCCEVKSHEFLKEVADEIESLNGRPTTSQRCRVAWKRYEATPGAEAKEALRAAYEAVPAHSRRYILGDQAIKDEPIRAVLYSTERAR